MATVASTPTGPFVHSTAARSTARQVPLEERVAVLEAHKESLTPTLATKADVRGAENRMIMWTVGTALVLAAVFAAMFTANTARLDGAIASNTARLDGAIAANTARLDGAISANTARIDKLDAKIDARFDALSTRIDKLDAKIDARFDAIMAELRTLRRPQ